MTLFASLKTASHATEQVSAGVNARSRNVASANDPDYHRNEVRFTYTGDFVRLDRNARVTDEGLTRALLFQSADAGYQKTLDDYGKQLSGIYGTDGNSPALSDAYQRFVQAWQDFQANPELDVTKRGVVSAGQRFTKVIRDTSIEIQKLTNETGRAIESDITEANRLLREISRNNAAATRSRVNGDSVGVAENQRDRALRDLSAILQVQTLTDEFGIVSVYSRSGSLLVGSSGVRELEYNSANREIKIIGGDIALASNAANNLPAGSLRAHFELIRDGAANTLSTKPETALYAKYSLMLDSLVDGLTNMTVADSLNAVFARHGANVPFFDGTTPS